MRVIGQVTVGIEGGRGGKVCVGVGCGDGGFEMVEGALED